MVFIHFSWLNNIKRIIFHCTWKLYEIQVSVSINKALLKHCHAHAHSFSVTASAPWQHSWVCETETTGGTLTTLHCCSAHCKFSDTIITHSVWSATVPLYRDFFFYQCITHHNKTRKEVDLECCPFQTQWSVGYFIIRLNSTGQCFSCNDTELKEYSKYQHYQRRHSSRSSQLTRMQRSGVLRNLKQNYFMRAGFLHKN